MIPKILTIHQSTLPWWGFLLSVGFTTVFMLFFGALNGISGFGYNIQSVYPCVSMVGS